MIGPRASWLLFRVGRRAAGIRSSAAVHRFGLASATAALILFAWILIVAAASYSARDQRAADREGVPAERAAEARAYWLPVADVLDESQFSVVFVATVGEAAAPPPGLARWPESGEVFISPELLDVEGEALAERYGTFAGTIGDAGLLYPSEWLVYIGTDAGAFRSRPESAIEGFGAGGRGQSSSSLDALSFDYVGDFLPLALPLLGLPTLALCVVAARSGAEERDRRIAILNGLGASPGALARVVVGEAAAPVLAGLSVGTLIALATTFVDLRLPATDYVVSAGDASAVAWSLPMIAVGTAAAMFGLAVALHRRPSMGQGPRPRRAEEARVWPRIVFPGGVILVVVSAVTTGIISTLLIAGGLCLIAGALPALLGGQARRLGSVIAGIGRRRNNAAALVGGRWLAARPETLSRMVSAFVIGVLLTSVVQVIVSRTPDEVLAARAAQRAVGDRVVVLRSSMLAMSESAAFATAIGADRVLYLREGASGQELAASCETLATLGPSVACPESPVPLGMLFTGDGELLSALISAVGPEIPVSTSPSAPGDLIDTMLILNTEGSVGLDRIRATAYRTLSFPFVSLPGDDWLLGWSNLNQLVQWPLDIQAPGAALLVLAALLAVAATYVSHIRTLGALSTYTTRRRFFMSVALWNLALPLALATLVACIVVTAVAELLRWMYGSERSAVGFIFTLGSGVAMVGLLFSVACGLIGAAAAQRWRPVAD